MRIIPHFVYRWRSAGQGRRGLRAIPAKVRLTPEGVGVPGQDPEYKDLDGTAWVQSIATALVAAAVADKLDDLLRAFEDVLGLVGFQADLTDTMDTVPHPDKAQERLPPAVSAVTDNWALLDKIAPDSIKNLSLDDLGSRMLFLTWLYKLQKAANSFATSVDKTVAMCEQDLVNLMRQVFKHAGSAMANNSKVHEKLEALATLFLETAKKAAANRKKNDVLKADTREETLAEVEQQQAEPPPPPAQPPQGVPAYPGKPVAQVAAPAATHKPKAGTPRSAPRGARKKPPIP